MITFGSIAVYTKHLAIFFYSFTAFAPRNYMVCFHFIYFKMLSTDFTDTLLLFIYSFFNIIAKSA